MPAHRAARLSDYPAGLIVSALLTLFIGALSVFTVTNPDLGYGFILVIMLAGGVCGPLLLALLIIWVAYLRQRPAPPGWLHAVLWLPPLLAASILPATEAWQQARGDRFDDAHPPRREIHVNLSGQTMLPDVVGYSSSGGSQPKLMAGDAPARFMGLTRYPARPSPYLNDSDNVPGMGYVWLYAQGRIAPGATDMAREADDARLYGATPPVPAQRLPLVPPPTYPQLDDLRGLLFSTTSAIEHLFFHYPDRTEVGAAIGLSGMDSLRLRQGAHDVVAVSVFVLGGAPVARLQIAGQEVRLGSSLAAAPLGHPDFNPMCWAAGGYVRLPLSGEWPVRWHTTEAPHTWQEAALRVPSFPSGEEAPGRLLANQMDLYVLPDGQLAAQRVQWRAAGQDKTALRATPLPLTPPCGTAERRVDPAHTQVLPP